MAKFLTSARTVDMLGRQQIAGIPTAMSELFKNAYDAYSQFVRADYLVNSGVLLLRDDGIGMSLDDFRTRWLTIGTDSKARNGRSPRLHRPAHMPERQQMGEKGIGRLAVASIGPQILVLSRAITANSQGGGPILVALVQWTLFEVPGLTLDDVVVPLTTIESIDDLTSEILVRLTHELRGCVEDLGHRIPPLYVSRISAELDRLSFDPRGILALPGPKYDTDRHGTAFLITPTNEDLAAALKTIGPDETNAFSRFLVGFNNTMLPSAPRPSMQTSFVVHEGGIENELIGPEQFWLPEDFDHVDHLIQGQFDEYGKFIGTVSVYRKAPQTYIEPWSEGQGRRSRCGGFSLTLGYVQGTGSESLLDPESFTLMSAKLRRIGGLYIYRDSIRVLPYGNSDFDYLQIEERRSRRASTAFFSYRRLFGAIEISSYDNPDLQEKAGREGFRDNAAYRDFVSILQAFLRSVAAGFFSEGGDQSDEWRAERTTLKKRASAREARERAETRERQRFLERLATALDRLESGALREDLGKVVNNLAESLVQLKNLDQILDAETTAANRIETLRQAGTLQRPSAGLNVEQERDWEGYSRLWAEALTNDFRITADRVREISDAAAREVRVAGSKQTLADSRRRRLQERSQTYADEVHTSIAKAIQASRQTSELVSATSQQLLSNFEAKLEEALVATARPLSGGEEEKILTDLSLLADNTRAHLERLSESLARITTGDADDRILKDQILDLELQADTNLELLQLGQAIQVVSHEFEANIQNIRLGLRRLDPWARANPKLSGTIRDLKASFQHLDGYLRLFTPLQRRLYRRRVAITGNEIASFVSGVFSDRLSRHNIDMEVTSAFRSWTLTGFPSTFYPVFINLVDNAIHWVSSERRDGRRILLDADDRGLLVLDNGPGVRPRDREAIFDRGFSRRRGGRGLGLGIARDLLQREGWSLDLDLHVSKAGAAFRIAPMGVNP